jgi:hypothetical protein
MKVLKLVVELEYNDVIMHSTDADEDATEWFLNDVLNPENGLYLHSNEIGDTVGMITSLEVRKENGK